MSSNLTIARPYAKAAFEYAKAHDLQAWLKALAIMAEVVSDPKIAAQIQAPNLTGGAQETLIETLCEGFLDDAQKRFISVLAENKRLHCLPEILLLFQASYDAYQHQIKATIFTPYPLTNSQQAALMAALKKRFKSDISEVLLTEVIQEDLIGGVVIRIGDTVIDNSIKGRLEQLATHLNLRENVCL